jgi:hypothetical protein
MAESLKTRSKRRPVFFFFSTLFFRRDAGLDGPLSEAGGIPGFSWIMAVREG